MRPIKIKEAVREVIRAEEKDKVALFIWGPPGIGKSTVVKDVTIEEKIQFIDMRLSQKDAVDLRGTPFPDKENRVTHWYIPDDLPKEGKGILFLDEMNLAPLLTQAAGYQLVLDRKLGDYTLPPEWTVIAAGNKPEHIRGGAKDLPLPLRNRFIHVEYEVMLEDWVQWAVKKRINPDVIAFLNFRPELLNKFDPETKDYAFPTPRSWEFVSKALTFSSGQDLISGAIGSGAAGEFSEFLRLRTKLPNIDKILAGEDLFPEGKEIGLMYALVSALALRAPKEKYNRLLEYSLKLKEEFAVLLIQMIVGIDTKAVNSCKKWTDWCMKYKDVILVKD